MKFGFLHILSIAAVFQIIVLTIYILTSRKLKTIKNYFLVGLLLSFAVLILCSVVLSSYELRNYYAFGHLGNQTVFLIGPFIYYYFRFSLEKDFRFSRKITLHFFPFVIVLIYLIIKFYFIRINISCRSNEIMIGTVAFIQTLIYFSLLYKLLEKQGISLKKIIRYDDNYKMNWFRLLVLGSTSIWLLKLLFFVFWDVSGIFEFCPNTLKSIFFLSFLFFNSILIFGLKWSDLFNGSDKYEYSPLKSVIKKEYKENLLRHLKEQKPYLDPELNLSKLSNNLSIPQKHLSQIINEELGVNFYDLINSFRIEESKRMLKLNGNSQSILEIAFSVGFNSKSTFNTVFKKITNLTPTQYRKLNSPVIL